MCKNNAIITTKKGFALNELGVYMHWDGDKDFVTALLKYCELQGSKAPAESSAGIIKIVQVLQNYFGGAQVIKLKPVKEVNPQSCANGVYIVDKWDIYSNLYNKSEHAGRDIGETMVEINHAQPESEQLNDAKLRAWHKCPKCGKLYNTFPALSRRDNVTEICSGCGVTEALEDWFGKPIEELESIVGGLHG